MKYFITGGSGFIGNKLAQELAKRGDKVTLLYHTNPPPHHPNISAVKGDIASLPGMQTAIKGHDFVFHLAAYAKPWAKDPRLFEKVNITGTLNVVKAAASAGVKRVVLTSTAGMFGPQQGEMLINEKANPATFFTDYERTKARAMKEAFELSTGEMEIVSASPSRVYGPGALSVSNAVTKMIKLYDKGLLRFIPGDGKSIGNYVYIDDVVHGHLLALEKGRDRENYLIGGENASFTDLFDQLSAVSGKKYPMFHLPIPMMMGIAHTMKASSRIFGIPPLITPPWVKRYMLHWGADITKARTELGYAPVSLKEGIGKTLEWLKMN